jgi:hypothetical protein
VAATEQGRRLGALEQMCVAAQRRFEKFNLDLAIEGGMVEEHRRALIESIRVKGELLKQKSNGLGELGQHLQKHQAMLQHQAAQRPPNPQAINQLHQTIALLGQQHVGNQKHCMVRRHTSPLTLRLIVNVDETYTFTTVSPARTDVFTHRLARVSLSRTTTLIHRAGDCRRDQVSAIAS